jgi:hypothetical protein
MDDASGYIPWIPYSTVNPTSSIISEAEQKACISLSDLFLDLELDDKHLSWIARDLRPLGIDSAGLENLLHYDVFPVLWHNFLFPVGEWGSDSCLGVVVTVACGLSNATFQPFWILDLRSL